MIEVDNLINELKLELLKMPLDERIKYLNSLGFEVSPLDESNNHKTYELSIQNQDIFNIWSRLRKSANGGVFYSILSNRHNIKRTQIIKVRIKPLTETITNEVEINNNYLLVKNLYKQGKMTIEDLIITFKIFYEDGTIEIQELRGNSRKCRILLNYLEQ